jgi:glycerol uptake facilitator-like aquaporin
VDDGRAFAVEVVWTFLLATVVLQTATTETQAGNSFFGLSIGLTVAAGAITVGRKCSVLLLLHQDVVCFLFAHSQLITTTRIPAISGGVFNPAVGTGVLVVLPLPPLTTQFSLKAVCVLTYLGLSSGACAGACPASPGF